jgi:hypothetical protein
MTSIKTETSIILITRHHSSCDGDSCGDASSSHHHHRSPHLLPAIVRKHHLMIIPTQIFTKLQNWVTFCAASKNHKMYIVFFYENEMHIVLHTYRDTCYNHLCFLYYLVSSTKRRHEIKTIFLTVLKSSIFIHFNQINLNRT